MPGTADEVAESTIGPSHRLGPVEFELWSGGAAAAAASGATFDRHSPFDGAVVARFANADAGDARRSIEIARATFDAGTWSRSSARTRHDVLNAAAAGLRERSEELARAMALEAGKPITAGRGEVAKAAECLEYFAGAALSIEGSVVSQQSSEALGLVLKEPVGVAALIGAWNFPLLGIVVKLAPALAAGCTAVAKPSHLCPTPALLLAHCLEAVGLPAGVFNVLTSDLDNGATVGQELAGSPLVDMVAFTGSTTSGRAVMRAACTNTKRVALELGGKSANIVFDDAPFGTAAATAVTAFCSNSGQQCSAGSRLLVQQEIHDEFVAAVVEAAGRQRPGDPCNDATTMGPLINVAQHARVLRYIEVGRADGQIVTGGGAPAGAEFVESLFVAPTVVIGLDNSSALAQEEVFGPVLAVIPFTDEEEAVRIANDSVYGLAGGVWTSSIDRAIRVASAVRTGKMFVNCYNTAGLNDLPHGGYKQSGLGREFGTAGLAEYQELKTVQIRIGAG